MCGLYALGPPPIAWQQANGYHVLSRIVSAITISLHTVLSRLVGVLYGVCMYGRQSLRFEIAIGHTIRDRGWSWRLSARAERQLQHLPAATAAAAVVVRPSRHRVLNKGLACRRCHSKLFIHLAYEAGPSATNVVPACASGRPSRVVVSSAAGLIITVTDGEGEVIEREARCATGPGPVAHDGGRSFCATATSAGLDGADLIRRC